MARKYKGLMKTNAKKLFALKGSRVKESQSQREEMAYTLRLSEQPRMKLLAQWCFDPIYKTVSFVKIMEKVGVDWRDIAKEYKALKKSQGEVEAAKYIPVLLVQTAEEAMSRDVPCTQCGATGEVLDPSRTKRVDGEEPVYVFVVCSVCHGSKVEHVKGCIDRLKLMFQTYELVGKNGPMVQTNIDLSNRSEGEKLGDLAKTLSGIVEGTARVKDEPTQ